MKSFTRFLCAGGLALGVVACSRLPRPPILGQVDAVAESRATQSASAGAPQAFAHAEYLKQRAVEAYESNQLELAEELAQHALAAYQHAQVQARSVAAQARLVAAQHELAETQEQLASLQHQQRSVSAQVEALELKIKVARDAEQPAPVEAASPKREAARRTTARSLVSNARLLCVAARMIETEASAPQLILTKLNELEQALESSSSPVPVGDAMRLRADCLTALTEARRVKPPASPAADPADQLVSQLDGAVPQAAPTRDDRGVVVAFSGLFDGGELSAAGTQRLTEMAQIARANPQLPMLVVLHTARREAKNAPARLQALKLALEKAGLAETPVYSVDDRLPLAVQPVKGLKLKDERVEFVFVAR